MRRSLGIICAGLVLLFSGYGLYRSLPLPGSLLKNPHQSASAPPSQDSEPDTPRPTRPLRMRNTVRPVWQAPSPQDEVARYAEVDSLRPRMVPVLLRPGDTALGLAHALYADVPDAKGDPARVGGRRLLMALTFELNGVDDPNHLEAGRRIIFYNTAAMSFTVDAGEGTLAEAVHSGRLSLDSAVVLIEGRGVEGSVTDVVRGRAEADPRYSGLALYLVVSNRTTRPQRAYIPRGRGFEVEDVSSNAQQLIVVETCSLRVQPGAAVRLVLPAVCINRPKKAPEAGTRVALTVLKATGSFAAALDEPPIRTQLAVWDAVGWMREQGTKRLAQATGGY